MYSLYCDGGGGGSGGGGGEGGGGGRERRRREEVRDEEHTRAALIQLETGIISSDVICTRRDRKRWELWSGLA
eukprot:373015-Rhodomonas_salina.1